MHLTTGELFKNFLNGAAMIGATLLGAYIVVPIYYWVS